MGKNSLESMKALIKATKILKKQIPEENRKDYFRTNSRTLFNEFS